MKPDLSTKTDIQKIVDLQYAQLLKHEETAHLFAHLDLEHHMPKIYTFWCFLLDINAAENRYTGSAFEPHVKLDLSEKHFELWLHFLHSSINENFEGEKANLWIEKSNQLGLMFQYKLGVKDFEIGVKKPNPTSHS